MPTKNNYKSVVYTAISGNKDLLKEIPENLRTKMTCVAFLDDISGLDSGWEQRLITDKQGDPNRVAKKFKILPHLFFPDYDYSLWIDGSVVPLTPIDELIERYLGDCDWAVHKHPGRNCAYEEAMVCGATGRDDPEIISKQMARYYVQEGFPRDFGLCENTVILRRHTDEVKEACEMWWKEIENGSRRDQLSFDYVRWKTGLEVKYMDDSIYSSSDFLLNRHLW